MNFPIEKYKLAIKPAHTDADGVEHGPTVIMISHYAGEVVKGVARCSPQDEFDLEYGKRLAAARCNEKILEKRVLGLSDKLETVVKELIHAQKQYNALCAHLENALGELNEAAKEVYELEEQKMDESED